MGIREFMSKMPTYKEVLLLAGSCIGVSVGCAYILVQSMVAPIYRELDHLRDEIRAIQRQDDQTSTEQPNLIAESDTLEGPPVQ